MFDFDFTVCVLIYIVLMLLVVLQLLWFNNICTRHCFWFSFVLLGFGGVYYDY